MRPARALFLLLCFSIAAPELRADVTVRYKSEFHTQAIPGTNPQNFVVPPVSVIQIKGNKAYSNLGLHASLVDSTTQQVTLLDAAHKLFATVLMKDYATELAFAAGSASPTGDVSARPAREAHQNGVASLVGRAGGDRPRAGAERMDGLFFLQFPVDESVRHAAAVGGQSAGNRKEPGSGAPAAHRTQVCVIEIARRDLRALAGPSRTAGPGAGSPAAP